jgi:DNA-binding MarR family transcriptional regulator
MEDILVYDCLKVHPDASIAKIVKLTGLTKQQIKASLIRLEGEGAIIKIARPGKSCVYEVKPRKTISLWTRIKRFFTF